MITPALTTGKEGMHWIYLSPHLDDAALSCGGLIWEQSQAGDQTSVWTVCAGDPPPGPLSPFAEQLHARWQTGRDAGSQRRQEDRLACATLNAGYQHISLPDCIYRQNHELDGHLYASEAAIFGEVCWQEEELIQELGREISRRLPAPANLVIPLALGGHIDHRLTRRAAEQIAQPELQRWYYADYPYVLTTAADLQDLRQSGWHSVSFPVSAAGLLAWQEAIAAHISQISTFWPDLQAMGAAIQAYHRLGDGIQLWRSRD